MSSDGFANYRGPPRAPRIASGMTSEKAVSLAGAAILTKVGGRGKKFFLDLRDFGRRR
jgi:hypothetical protein